MSRKHASHSYHLLFISTYKKGLFIHNIGTLARWIFLGSDDGVWCGGCCLFPSSRVLLFIADDYNNNIVCAIYTKIIKMKLKISFIFPSTAFLIPPLTPFCRRQMRITAASKSQIFRRHCD
jgi:hypothetical protein